MTNRRGPIKGLREALEQIQDLFENFGADSPEVKFFIKEYREREADTRAHSLVQAMFTFCIAEEEGWLEKEKPEER